MRSFVENMPTTLFAGHFQLVLAQDSFSKSMHDYTLALVERKPQWVQEACKSQTSLASQAQQSVRRSSMPMTGLNLPPVGGGAGGATGDAVQLEAEIKRLQLRNKTGASAYESLRKQAMQWKDEIEQHKTRVAFLEKKLAQQGVTRLPSSSPDLSAPAEPPDPFSQFSFPTAAAPRPETPGLSKGFDPASQSLI